MFDIIVIGAGMAGMTACLYALRNNKKVLLIEQESIGGQIATSPKVENYPGIKSISGVELTDGLFDQIDSLNVEFELDEVKEIKKLNNHFIVEGKDKNYQALSVIIATGAKHRRLGLEREEEFLGKGIYYCAICDGPFFAGQEVAVIGDANSAMQYALMLSEYCSKVTMVTLFDKLFGEKTLQDAVRSNEKIKIIHNAKATGIIDNGGFEGVRFEKTDKSTFDVKTKAVFIAIGQVPENGFVKNLTRLDKNGYIVAGEDCKTDCDGLFVAGDCRTKDIRQCTTAVADGATAAMKSISFLNSISGK